MTEKRLQHPLPGIDDPEGEWVPLSLPPVVDAQVQCFAMDSRAMHAVKGKRPVGG